MWKTTNYKGEEVTWYSEEEYAILDQEAREATEIIAELEWECKKIEDIIKVCNSLKHNNEEYIKIDEVLNG